MVPVYLDELTTHAARVQKPMVEPLLSALFEIHDEIDLEKDADKGLWRMANTSLRLHWFIRRLTRGRFSIDERTDLYLAATERAALGWLVDFVSSARRDYRERQNQPTPEEDCLVITRALEPLTKRALAAIRAAAASGSLLHHQDLHNILYGWRNFLDNDPAEVRAWTDKLISDDNALVILARAMTGRTWSMGMGGFGSLGDRVSKASPTAQIADDTDILDVNAFYAGLERIRDEAKIDAECLEVVRTFLHSWDRQRRGEHD
jgi:hypothetical protein